MALVEPLQLTMAARRGDSPVSMPRVATRVEGGNVLLELDGQSALSVSRDILGRRAAERPAVSIEVSLASVQAGSGHRQPAPAQRGGRFGVASLTPAVMASSGPYAVQL